LARDLRLIVRERIKAGDTDEQVVDYIVARYGRFVLLRPPLEPQTYIVWFGPFILLVIALATVIVYARHRAGDQAEAPLTADERRRIDELTKEE
jgi:cytochrome c-type biogenesis protein CcmH